MSILDKELYHGAALTQIVEATGFESVRKASFAFGHYEINGLRRVLVRHSASESSPWYFTFKPRHLHLLRDDQRAGIDAFLCLVCGNNTICILTYEQLIRVVHLDAETMQSIRVSARVRSSIHVTGSAGSLDEKVYKHAFPARLLHG